MLYNTHRCECSVWPLSGQSVVLIGSHCILYCCIMLKFDPQKSWSIGDVGMCIC